MTIPQKSLDLSKLPSMSKSLSTPIAMGAIKETLQNKDFAKTQLRTAQKLAEQKISTGARAPVDQIKAMALLKRRLANSAGTPTVSQAVERTLFAGEQAAEKILIEAGKTHFLKAGFRSPGLTAAQVERRAIKTFVGKQKPVDTGAEVRARTAKIYQMQRAEEADEAPAPSSGRAVLQKMEEQRNRGEEASAVLKSAETGIPLPDRDNKKEFQPPPAIPFAK